jgi:methyl-accepting chemotaxis protein
VFKLFKKIKIALKNYDAVENLCNTCNVKDIYELTDYITSSINKANELSQTILDFDSMKKEIVGDINLFISSYSEVGQSINDIAIGATEQAQSVQNVMVLFNKLSNFINDMDDKLWSLIEDMEKMVSKVKNGTYAVDILDKKILESVNSSNIMNNNIKELISSSKSVSKFTNVIKEISETIKLLSFNAQIEAARAGENGKGFSVIANEVNKLAQKTIETTKEINNTVQNIDLDIEKVLNSMKLSESAINEATLNLEKTNNVFIDI